MKSSILLGPSLLFIAFSACLITGCGGSDIVPVEAKFTIDGEPLADASVSLIRVNGEKGRAAFGMTDASGVAKLTTYKPFDGALPGNYAVVVIKAPENAMTYEVTEIDPNDTEAVLRSSAPNPAAYQSRRKRVRTTIPEVYAAQSTTPLKAKVEPGMDTLVLELSSQ